MRRTAAGISLLLLSVGAANLGAAESLSSSPAQRFASPPAMLGCATAGEEPDSWVEDEKDRGDEKQVLDCREPKNKDCWECNPRGRDDIWELVACCRHECDVICNRDSRGYCVPG